jgi:hypothetical protein
MGLPVTPDAESPAAYYGDETASPTTTRTTKTIPGGAKALEIGLFPTTASATTARFLFVCFNALSDSEAASMLANVGSRVCIPAGKMEKFVFPTADPLIRYDFTTDAASETAGSKCIQRIGSLL